MARIPYEQSNFTQGELSPNLYARTDTEGYYKGAKLLSNCLVTPEGGYVSRFGTAYVDQSATTNRNALNGYYLTIGLATYLIEFGPNIFYVYLENTLLTDPGIVTQYPQEDVSKLKFTQARERVIISSGTRIPTQIVNSGTAPAAITGFIFSGLTGTFAASVTTGRVIGVKFAGTMPAPTVGGRQLYAGRTYYAYVLSATTILIYDTPAEASYHVSGVYTFTSAGACTVSFLNVFTISDAAFQNLPSYDFGNGYDGVTFTPSAVFGTVATPLTLTASATVFTTEHVGGVFRANGGIIRILAIGGDSPSLTATGYTVKDFPNTNAIAGGVADLEQPAWSDALGWPKECLSFENRVWFAESGALHGVWGSCTGEYFNFDDSNPNDDSGAISWYPESGGPVIINALTAANSLLAHTERGTYSSPTFTEINLTPSNFVLKLQDADGVSSRVKPVVLDNQVLYVDKGGANVNSLKWQTEASKYTKEQLSVKASHLIKSPIDAVAFTNPAILKGALYLIINSDGTLTIFQTLLQENIAAFSSAFVKRTLNGVGVSDRFIQMVSSGDRVWFWIQRGDNIFIEELRFSYRLSTNPSDRSLPINLDSTLGPYTVLAANATLINSGFLEGSVLSMEWLPEVAFIGNSGIEENIVVGAGGVATVAPVNYRRIVFMGYPFVAEMRPLPIGTIPGTPCTRYADRKIVGVYIYYKDTNGATVNGQTIFTHRLPVPFGPPLPSGTYISEFIEIGGEWDVNTPDIIIQQSHCLPFNILAIAYIVEV